MIDTLLHDTADGGASLPSRVRPVTADILMLGEAERRRVVIAALEAVCLER